MCSAPIFCVLHALIIAQSLALRKPSVLLCAKVDDHSSPGLKAPGFSGHANKITSFKFAKRQFVEQLKRAITYDIILLYKNNPGLFKESFIF
jgi:hypothetical protein